MRTVVAAVAVLVTMLAGSMAGAGAASGHAARIAADPPEDSRLTQPPERVSATFNEPMQPQFAAMTVVGPDGNLWSTGEPQVDGPVLSVAVRPLGPAGKYTVNYRATSADGHVLTGSWSFELTAPGPGTPGPPAGTLADTAGDDAADGDGIPVWPFFVGAVVIIAGGALWAVRRRR